MHDEPITQLLRAAHAGDEEAARRAWQSLYPELVKIARGRLRGHLRDTLLDTHILVHESFLRLVRTAPQPPDDRTHFFAYAAKVMRHIVVDYARRKGAQRRGGDRTHVTLDTSALQPEAEGLDLLEVDAALDALAALEPALAQVVELRYYGGYTDQEIATALGVSDRTIRRHWDKARAFMWMHLGPDA